jgi:hypothetical protein
VRVLPLLKYSVMRLALFVAAMGLLYLIGIQALLPNLLCAGVISLLLSYVLLRRPREELSQQIAGRVEARLHDPERRSRIAEDAEIEDAAADELTSDRATDRATDRPRD